MKSSLVKRIEKSKLLRFTSTSKIGQFNTWGSDDDHYIITLISEEKEIITPDGYLTIKVFRASCKKQWYGLDMKKSNPCACKGNIRHTVCYHSLGAIFHSFKQVEKCVSFYETFRDADRALSFGGFIAKIVNQNGKGHLWAVVRDKDRKVTERKVTLLPAKVNIDLMRGDIGDEGID